jgi:hypothetical protein
MGCIGKGGIYGSGDAAYFAMLEAERNGEVAQLVEYYSLNRGKNVDVVYGEPDNDPLYGGTNPNSPRGTAQTHDLSWNFCPDVAQGDEPFLFHGIFEFTEFENRQPSVRPEGKMVEWDAMLSVSKNAWLCAISAHGSECLAGRTPKEGDVLYGFDLWWDVVRVGSAGNVLATPVTVGYRFELKKRSQFTPDRKIWSP